jgi:hypothetical protein
MVALIMVTRRRCGRRDAHTTSVTHASKKPRTRTSLIGVTIYQPDIESSPLGRKLLDALDSTYSRQKPVAI